MLTRKQVFAIAIFALTLVIVTAWVSDWVSAYSPDYYQEIQKNVEMFGRVYQEISKKYVEEVDPDKFMKAGIDGMLATLDPYTVLMENEDNAELQIMSSGKYGGLGMRIGMRNDWPTVVEPPFDGTPAIKAGIREGDRIVKVDGQVTKGMSIAHVANLLRGEIGSEVFLEIVREGEVDPIEFRLIRDEIIVTDVVYSGILKDGIGYIRLSHFSRNAGKDIEKSIRQLKNEGLKALILDLRSNPGGLLEAAVNVCENFTEKGKLIVSTEGRSPGSLQKYYSEKNPILEDMPLVVLVNGLSASASEIVAGAVQDLDRGVIVGTNTFGKGLVQTVIPISGEAALKITTAKYLIPSGRSIQDPNKFNRSSEDVMHNAKIDVEDDENIQEEKPIKKSDEDTKKKGFHTANGRNVYASHGIAPDIVVEDQQLNRFQIELLRKTMPFQFAVIYAAQHPELQKGFVVTEQMLTEFDNFLKKKNFVYTSEGEEALQKIETLAKRDEYLASAEPSIEELQKLITAQKLKQFEKSKHFIKEELEQEISAKLWGTRAEIEASFDDDEVVQKALTILSDADKYHAILNETKSKK